MTNSVARICWIVGVALAGGVMSAPRAAQAAGGAWQAIGPDGGRVPSIAVDPSDPATAYAATENGLFKTVDAGSHWALTGEILPFASKVVIDPAAPGAVYAIAGFLLHSRDGGATWQQLWPPTGTSAGVVADLAIDPRASGTLYLATGTQVQKSVDGGAHWTATGAELPDHGEVTALAIASDAATTVYAGTFSGLWQSADAGASWQKTSAPTGGEAVAALAVDASLPGRVYAATAPEVAATPGQKPAPHGVLVSADGGGTWFRRQLAADAPAVLCLAVPPGARGTVYAGATAGIYRSTDGGFHWQSIADGLAAQPFASLGIAPSLPDRIYAGSGVASGFVPPAVFRTSSAGGAWQPAGGGLHGLPVTSVAADPFQPESLYVAGLSFGVTRSADDGATWQWADRGLRGSIEAVVASPAAAGALYAVGFRSSVAMTTDSAAQWSQRPAPFEVRAIPGAAAADPQNPAILYSAGIVRQGTSDRLGLWKTVDAGATWHEQLDIGDALSTSFAVAVSPTAVYLLVASSGPIALPRQLLVSHDGGATFAATAAPNGVGFITLDPSDPGTLYLGPGIAGLYKSVDEGRTLQPLQPPTPGNITSLAIDPSNHQLLYAGGYGEVLASRDGGLTWDEPLAGLPAGFLVEGVYVGASGELYALEGDLYRYVPSPSP